MSESKRDEEAKITLHVESGRLVYDLDEATMKLPEGDYIFMHCASLHKERDELLEALKALPRELAYEGMMANGTTYRKYVVLADQLDAAIAAAEKRKG